VSSEPQEQKQNALDAVRQWRQAGVELRADLEREREALQERLAEVEKALAELPAGDDRPSTSPPSVEGLKDAKKILLGRPTMPPPEDLRAMSYAQMATAIVSAYPDGVTAPDIMRIGQRSGKENFSPQNMHAALYRLTKKTRALVSRGPRGAMKYYVNEEKGREQPLGHIEVVG